MVRLVFAALFALALPAYAAVKEEPVTYKAGDTVMKGFVVYDDAVKGKRPGIVLVHEWWGITDHIRNEARRLAAQGYTAFVADMYGDAKTADNPKDASGLMKSLMGNPASMTMQRAPFLSPLACTRVPAHLHPSATWRQV